MGDEGELQPDGVSENGVSRREVMRRGALLAGAAAWSTPVVRSLSQPAFAAEGTPEGKVSWVAFVLSAAQGPGNEKRVKWEEGAGWEDDPGPTSEQTGPTSDCVGQIRGWDDADPANGGALGIDIQLLDDGDTVVATLPSTSDVVFDDGRAFGGGACVTPSSRNKREYRFEF